MDTLGVLLRTPFAALIASALVLFSGVAFAVGMQSLGPPLDA